MAANEELAQLRNLVQGYIRHASRHPDGRRFTQADLGAAIGLDAKEFSLRLNHSRGQRLSAAQVRALVGVLAEQGAITTVAQADELLHLAGATPISDSEQQRPPLSQLERTTTVRVATASAPDNAASDDPRLNAFREQLRELLRRADTYADGRHPRQQDLAAAIGLAPTELSRRFNKLGASHLTSADVRAIVRTLADWGAISTRAEAEVLLRLMAAPSFSAAEWAASPLDLLTDEAPPLSSPVIPPHNLPRLLTSFIGRGRELDAGAALLTDNPLLTISGPGGIGKTRFSLELAKRMLPRYSAGVYFIELAAITDPALIPQAVAAALGLRGTAEISLTEQLISYLADKPLLLILDNCEQVSDAVASFAQQLLARCPQLAILATSRERLNVIGETVFPLRALALPRQDQHSPAQLATVDAAQLFVVRARAIRPDFSISAQNATDVAAIVNHLEGIPLAIELAAPLVEALSPGQLAQRLDERLNWLVSHNPALPARQRTLRASITWSYDLLIEQEQLLFRRLAIFSGGWELAAAEAICADGDDFGLANVQRAANTDQLDTANLKSDGVLRALARLVRASLVQSETQADGEMRYSMLVTVREFATEQLAASGVAEAVAHRHAHLFLTLAEQAEPELRTPSQDRWLTRLEQEHDNLRAALTWLLQHEPDNALRAAAAIFRFWEYRGYITEGRRWLGLGLDATNQPTVYRAEAAYGAGTLAIEQGDYPTAQVMFEQGLQLSRQLDDAHRVMFNLTQLGSVAYSVGNYPAAREYYAQALDGSLRLDRQGSAGTALSNLGMVARAEGDYRAARAYYQQSLSILRKVGNNFAIAGTLVNFGNTIAEQGDTVPARKLYDEALSIYREFGNSERVAFTLSNLGMISAMEENYAAARQQQEEALRLYQEAGDQWGIAFSLHELGGINLATSDYAAAQVNLDESLQIARKIGDRERTTYVLNWLGQLARQRGNYVAAIDYHREALATGREIGNRPGVAAALIGLGADFAVRGNPADFYPAAVLLSSGMTVFRTLGAAVRAVERLAYEYATSTCRAQLAEAEFAAAQSEGDALDLAAAISYAAHQIGTVLLSPSG